jgi:antitoxin (DNA-binding transcriptional repressor) of toxin-antitoxin stability system
MQTLKIGIREFREKLASILQASGPVAITRHGETVGYYIPARPSRKTADLDALRRAAQQLDALLAASGATEDELLNEFKEARARIKQRKIAR